MTLRPRFVAFTIACGLLLAAGSSPTANAITLRLTQTGVLADTAIRQPSGAFLFDQQTDGGDGVLDWTIDINPTADGYIKSTTPSGLMLYECLISGLTVGPGFEAMLPQLVTPDGAPLLAQVNLSSATPLPSWTVGQALTIVNGFASSGPSVRVGDIRSMPSIVELVAQPMPDYTGEAVVAGFLLVRVIPEPASFHLATIAVAAVARHRRR
jgi:hypothetical protein